MSNFTNHATYLQWRQEWKASYKELSKNIREAKIKVRDSHRKLSKEYCNVNKSAVWIALCALDLLKQEANEMLAERAQAKIDSHIQYMENKNGI